MKKIILSLALTFSLANAGMFEKGDSSFGVVLGSGSSYDESYVIFGVSGEYFAMDGLSVGAGYRAWFGADPTQNQLTLSSSYYFMFHDKFHPYVGVFGRETFVEDYDNRTSYGARGGLAVTMSSNTYASIGWAYEEYSSCTETRFKECSTSYPEIVFSLSF